MSGIEPSMIGLAAGSAVHTPSRLDGRLGRPLKSLLISSMYFPPQVGGISHAMAAIASALGPDRICCLTAVPANEPGTDNGFTPRVYRRPAAFGKVRHLHALAWGATLSEIMIRERPQIVQLATAYEGYLGLWLRRWFKLPFVIYVHGNEILDVIQGDWEKPRLALQRADRVLANSRFTANLLQKAGVDPNRVEIVHLGCDVYHFRPQPASTELRQKLLGDLYRNRVILTVGNLVPRKGHDMVIRALPRISETVPDVTYLVIGDGPYRGQLEALVEAMSLRDRVVFAGRVLDRDLPDLYALSDVFVMASRAQFEACDVEGFGLVFLEANACGKPVIGGRSGGIPEAIEDGVSGLLVDPHDPEDIANAITRLLIDPELSARFGQQGRLRVARDFTWSRVGAQVQGILESILREKSTSS